MKKQQITALIPKSLKAAKLLGKISIPLPQTNFNLATLNYTQSQPLSADTVGLYNLIQVFMSTNSRTDL